MEGVMKIGMIAMSGVRADNPDVTREGLSMPGIMERGHVIASLPSLSLLTLAALTPPDIEVEYREVRDLAEGGGLPMDYDLVAISSLSSQVLDAYALARRYRQAGAAVVMGGLHVTAVPDDAAPHCTSIVVGEGESVWPRLIEDFRNGRLAPRYGPEGEFDLAAAPVPRYDLLDFEKYNRIPVQTSRGCPHRCDFCAGSIMLTRRYKVKPIERVTEELRKIKSIWRHPFIELADDNSFVNRTHARKLLAALKAERVRWFTECDISIANDPSLLDHMREAGCREVLIGLESPRPEGLDGVELRRNWKLRQLPRYEAAVRAIQARGIAVNGCFVLGLDGDTEETFEEIYRFAQRTCLFDIQLTVLTPFPGTPLYARLLSEGRILQPGAWNKCTLFDVNFVPRHMSPERLQSGFMELVRRVYEPSYMRARREGFMDLCRTHAVRPVLGPDGMELDAVA
jgi:radical SAM superfamily enzyme YgiQ (UPF0313 family)